MGWPTGCPFPYIGRKGKVNMKTIKIGGKNYKFEYSLEASLYQDCVENIARLMSGASKADDGEDEEAVIKLAAISPSATFTLFYAGLMENHGLDGDNSVLSENDAKRLIKIYYSEHKNDKTGDPRGLMGMLFEVMREDGFFRMIGLDGTVEEMHTREENPMPKVPQDHKPKATKVSEK